MGLLDEAIREHLELKRRRGGDPSEIAREEQEALAPVFGEPSGPAAEPEGEDGAAYAGPSGELEDQPSLAAAHDDGFSSVGQETAELDMQSILGVEELLTEEHPAPPPPKEAQDDSGWQAPSGAADAPPEPGPGQERLSFE